MVRVSNLKHSIVQVDTLLLIRIRFILKTLISISFKQSVSRRSRQSPTNVYELFLYINIKKHLTEQHIHKYINTCGNDPKEHNIDIPLSYSATHSLLKCLQNKLAIERAVQCGA